MPKIKISLRNNNEYERINAVESINLEFNNTFGFKNIDVPEDLIKLDKYTMTEIKKLQITKTFLLKNGWGAMCTMPYSGENLRFNDYLFNQYCKLWTNDSARIIINNTVIYYSRIREEDLEGKLYAQKIEINNDSHVHMIGDIHSSLFSFRNILINLQENGFLKEDLTLVDNHYIIFLGDLIDRGYYSIEVLLIACKLKLQNPNNVFIINGNHEDSSQYNDINKPHLSREIMKEDTDTILNIDTLLTLIPTIMFLKYKNKTKWIQLNHGAFSPYWDPKDWLIENKKYHIIHDNQEDLKHREIKWGDFSNGESIGRADRPRFNSKQTREYLNNNNISMIVSGHQDFEPINVLYNVIKDNIPSPYYNIDNFEQQLLHQVKLREGGTIEKGNIYRDIPVTEDNINDDDDKVLAIITSTANQSKKFKENKGSLYNKDVYVYLTMTNDDTDDATDDATGGTGGATGGAGGATGDAGGPSAPSAPSAPSLPLHTSSASKEDNKYYFKYLKYKNKYLLLKQKL